jgi:hypothetical protein
MSAMLRTSVRLAPHEKVYASRTTRCGNLATETTSFGRGKQVQTRMPVRLAYAAITLAGMTMLASCAKKDTAQTVDTTATALAVDTTATRRGRASGAEDV